MVLKHFARGIAFVAIVATAMPAGAQQTRTAAPQQDEQVQARYRISVMEGVLERAVLHGADLLRHQVRRLVPEMLMLNGGAEARGFPLEGYGILFDVEVPVMRRSMAWTLKTMVEEQDATTTAALQQLRTAIDRMSASSPGEKQALLQAIRRLEMQVTPLAPPPPAAGPQRASVPGTVAALDAAPQAERPSLSKEEAALLDDPNAAYEDAVVNALIDAMLEHGPTLHVRPDEWLTVAARDNEHRNLVPGDPYDLLTIVLRVKGSELDALREGLRAGRITREEARKRVEKREF